MKTASALSYASLALAGLLLAVPIHGQAQPVITVPPTNKTVRVGETAFFTVTATGTPPLTYQWRKNGSVIPGATSATLALGLARPDLAGNYSVVAQNPSGSVTSAPAAVLTVRAVPPGAVVAWGWNNSGQTTVPVAAQGGVTAIAGGWSHSVALTINGAVVAWGDNRFGQTTVPVTASSGVTAIAAGWSHTAALSSDGAVVAWGLNGSGQTTVPVAAQSGVTAIAAGYDHSVALKSNGAVVAWGGDGDGQSTVPVAAQSGVTAISAGIHYTLALKSDGSIVAWGKNDYGQAAAPLAAQDGVVAISAGNWHAMALKSDGSVVAWGEASSGKTDVPAAAQSGVTAIAAGTYHSLGLKSDGSIVAWGYNAYGQTVVPTGFNWAMGIAAGGNHTVAFVIPPAPVITEPPTDQTVNVGQSASFGVTVTGFPLHYQWRKDGVDLPGAVTATFIIPFTQTNDSGNYTVVVSNFAGSVTSAPPARLTVTLFPPSILVPPVDQTLNVGQSASFGVLATGYPLSYQWRKDGADIVGATSEIYSLGLARTDQAGNYTVVVRNPAGAVTSTPSAALVVQEAIPGFVVAWGDNFSGQTDVPVTALGGVAAIAAGADHTVALKRDGWVVAWGNNAYGQTTVPFTAFDGVTAIAAGANHTVALSSDGAVVAWGDNRFGQTAVPVAARSGVTAIAAGYDHSVALKSNGAVVAWGDNRFGQTTVPLAAQSGVTAIAARDLRTVALKRDGSVVAWGDNRWGQTTVPVTASSGVTAIAAGGTHTVALKFDGSVVGWGNNAQGETTAPVAAQSGVTAIAAGGGYTVALKRDGSVVAWGYNSSGQATVPVAAQNGVTAIASGGNHTVAIVTPTAPAITTSPLSQTVVSGDAVTLFVQASGTPPPSYQWQLNGLPIPDATSSMLQLGSITRSQAGSYSVVVSNVAGTVTSELASIVVSDSLQFDHSSYSIPETVGVAILNVLRRGDGLGTVTVNYTTSDGTATEGQDYAETSGTLTFGPGETSQTISVPILNDDLVEGHEPFLIALSNPTDSVLGPNNPASVTILDNDTGVEFLRSRYSFSETSGVTAITVRRGDDGTNTVTVDYATSDGTATAGQDYTATSGTLTFEPGEREKTFTIPILDDALPERAETVRLSLSNLTGPAVFGPNTNAQLTIIDDEQSSSGTRARPVLAAGSFHTLALKADGSLWAWGWNGGGQLGIGADFGTGTNAPGRVGSDNDWATVAVGISHTLAIKADGSLWAWGNNCSRQLGLGEDCAQNTNAPARVGTDNDWVLVAAGDYHSVGLKADGSVWAWGSLNGASQPAQIGADFDWAWIGAGWNRALAVKQDGTLWELYANDSTPIGTDNDWEMVVTAGVFGVWSNTYDAVALKTDGSLWSWGSNGYGQLGDGTTNFRNEPGRVGADNHWVAVAAAVQHTLALKSDGSLWSWGANWSGQLGLGVDGGTFLEPNLVGLDDDWTTIAAGWDYSIGLRSDGSLWAWGENGGGKLGLGLDCGDFCSTNVPTRIGADNDWAQPMPLAGRGEFRIVAQSLNPDHSRTLFFTHTNARAYYILYRSDSLTNITQPVDSALASAYPHLTDRTPPATNATAFYRIRAVPRTQPLDLDQDGIDDDYELRHATFLHPLNPSDAAQDYDADGYSNLSEYRAGTDPARPTTRHSVAAGLGHTVVLKQDGSLWAWGRNNWGQLGDGTFERREQPVRIGTDTDWVSVSAGRDYANGDFTVALRRDGSLWLWGSGNGANAPRRLGNQNSWADVSAGGNFIVAVKKDGSLWYPQAFSPDQRIGIDHDWVTVSSGGLHVLALKADRSLWAWGDNEWGQCGLGEGAFVGNTPTRVGTDNDWKAISASGDTDPFNGAHSLALKVDGTLWAWGLNQAGELGLGSSDLPQFTPARVGADTDWAEIAVSGGNSIARKRTGDLWAWGANSWGQLGNGTILPQRTPIQVGTDHDWRAFAVQGTGYFGDWETSTVALKNDGTLWAWGWNYHGGLGIPPYLTPTRVGLDTNWVTPP